MNTGETPPRAVLIKCALQPRRQLVGNKTAASNNARRCKSHAETTASGPPLGRFLSAKTHLVLEVPEVPAPTLPGATALRGDAERETAAALCRAVAKTMGLGLFFSPLNSLNPLFCC